MTKVEKYGNYKDVLKARPDIVQFINKQIDETPHREIFVKAIDMGNNLGPNFENLGEESIYWGLKVALVPYGIFASRHLSVEINPATNRRYLLLKLSRLKD